MGSSLLFSSLLFSSLLFSSLLFSSLLFSSLLFSSLPFSLSLALSLSLSLSPHTACVPRCFQTRIVLTPHRTPPAVGLESWFSYWQFSLLGFSISLIRDVSCGNCLRHLTEQTSFSIVHCRSIVCTAAYRGLPRGSRK